MKNALIFPDQPCESGYAVVEVAEARFDVAAPLFWVDCSDDVQAYQYWYDPSDESIKPIPEPEAPAQPIVDGAETL